MYCKNHPSVETRVSCSDCGDPICPDCMVFAPVGAKCPDCGRMPKSALIRVKPERLVLTVAAGLVAAIVGGFLFNVVIASITFFGFLVAFAVGMGIGEVISWASGRFHGSRLAAWAASCAAFGILFPYLLRGFLTHGASGAAVGYALAVGGIWKLLWLAAAAYGAWQRNA